MTPIIDLKCWICKKELVERKTKRFRGDSEWKCPDDNCDSERY